MLALWDLVLGRLSPSVRTINLRIPRETPPNSTMPSISETIAASFGLARLEELGDARQAAGDVAGLRLLTADLDQHVAGRHLLAVAHLEARAGRQRIVSELLTGLVEDVDRRLQLLVAVFHDDELLGAAGVVDFRRAP